MKQASAESTPGRRRRVLIIGLAILLTAAYPLSYGPVTYFEVRGWIPGTGQFYLPAVVGLQHTRLRNAYHDYLRWWWITAVKHEAGRSQ